MLVIVEVGLETVKLVKPKGRLFEWFLEGATPKTNLLPNLIKEEMAEVGTKVGQIFQFPKDLEWSAVVDVSPENWLMNEFALYFCTASKRIPIRSLLHKKVVPLFLILYDS